MADKKLINDYCKEVADEFVENYTKELDSNIYKMLNAFGFEGDVNDAGKWLDDVGSWLVSKDYDLKIDEDKRDNLSIKKFYLIDNKTNIVIGIFAVKLYGEEDLTYEFSDVYVLRDEEN